LPKNDCDYYFSPPLDFGLGKLSNGKDRTVEAAYCDHFGTNRNKLHQLDDNVVQTPFSNE